MCSGYQLTRSLLASSRSLKREVRMYQDGLAMYSSGVSHRQQKGYVCRIVSDRHSSPRCRRSSVMSGSASLTNLPLNGPLPVTLPRRSTDITNRSPWCLPVS